MGKRTENSYSVLVVENDRDFLTVLRNSLEKDKQGPSRIDTAFDFDEAYQKLRINTYDLVLLESQLEGQPALSLIEEIQRDQKDLPFILMTPVRDDKLVKEAKKQGVANILIKDKAQFNKLASLLRQSLKNYRKNTNGKKKGSKTRKTATGKIDVSREEKAPQLAIRDQITGLYNHSYLHERIVEEFSRANRYKYPISCLLVDIDHFKTLNEEHGYRIGDTILRECANVLFETCRVTDLIARYGGGEFAILLPHVNYAGAVDLANRLRLAFSEHMFRPGSEDINMTISVGMSSYPEDEMTKRCELITYANQALFRSKAAGRNRVTLYRDIVPMFGDTLPALKISQDKVDQFQRRLSEISDTARRAYIDASKALIVALESKDRFTAGHGASCAKYSMQVAEAMGMSVDEAEVVEHGALLHDIGKICIPDNILLKPGKLTFEEYEIMKQHPYMGYKILKPIKFLQEEAVLVLHHHEWFNGEGYPCRLAGSEIPLGARIIAVIDTYDTIRIAGGRYKKTSLVEDAVNELIDCSGTQFDPEVVKAFIEVLKMRKELQSDRYNQNRLEEILQSCHLR